MAQKTAKKLRKQYREKINSLAMRDLKKEIFRLARNRDILGIILILENILFAILFLIFIASR
jgi:hypothetical protein